MVKMRRPSCSQHGLFEATCCLMCSCWSPFQTEQRIIYFDLVFGDSEPDRHSRQVILLLFWDIAYFFLFTRNIFKNNCIKSVEAALHKSWGIFKFFIPTAVTGAFFFLFGQSLNYFQAVKLWMRNLFLSGSTAGSSFASSSLFWDFLQHLRATFIQNLVCAVWKNGWHSRKRGKDRTLFLKNKLHNLRHLQTSVPRFVLFFPPQGEWAVCSS